MNCSRNDTVTGQFLGLYETLWYLMVRGFSDEFFLDYGYLKQNSKIIHSYHRKRMPNSFSGTFFNRYRIQYQSGALNIGFSKMYLFLPSVTDHIEDVNRHMGSVIIPFDPSKLSHENLDKKKWDRLCLRCLRKSSVCQMQTSSKMLTDHYQKDVLSKL